MVTSYINKEEVLRYLGHKNQKIDSSLDRLIDESIIEIDSYIKKGSIYKAFDIIQDKDGLLIKNTNVRLIGRDIIYHLKGSSKCIIIGATLGHEIDRIIRYYEKLSMTKAIILDAIASVAIEALVDKLNNKLKIKVSKDKKALTSRYSPGYGDLPLTIQGPILDILDAKRSIGLTVNQSNILIPRKSITAIIGIIEEGFESKGLSCQYCDMKDNCNFSKGGVGCGN